MKLPNLKDADCVWKLIESMDDVFVFARDELRQIEKNGWEGATSHRQKIEYTIICAQIIRGFFRDYYDLTIFRSDVGSSGGVERVQMREGRANEIMRSLYQNIRNIYAMRSPLLAPEHHVAMYEALVSLNNAASAPIVATVEILHLEEGIEEVTDHVAVQTKKFLDFIALLKDDASIGEECEQQVFEFMDKLEALPRKDAQVCIQLGCLIG